MFTKTKDHLISIKKKKDCDSLFGMTSTKEKQVIISNGVKLQKGSGNFRISRSEFIVSEFELLHGFPPCFVSRIGFSFCGVVGRYILLRNQSVK